MHQVKPRRGLGVTQGGLGVTWGDLRVTWAGLGVTWGGIGLDETMEVGVPAVEPVLGLLLAVL